MYYKRIVSSTIYKYPYFLQEDDCQVWMEAYILLTIEQLWAHHPTVSGIYVEEDTLIVAGKDDISINSITGHASAPVKLLMFDTIQKKLKPFCTTSTVRILVYIL